MKFKSRFRSKVRHPHSIFLTTYFDSVWQPFCGILNNSQKFNLVLFLCNHTPQKFYLDKAVRLTISLAFGSVLFLPYPSCRPACSFICPDFLPLLMGSVKNTVVKDSSWFCWGLYLYWFCVFISPLFPLVHEAVSLRTMHPAGRCAGTGWCVETRLPWALLHFNSPEHLWSSFCQKLCSR